MAVLIRNMFQSYGGFATLRALSHDLNKDGAVFKCGMSVAPVTSYRLYGKFGFISKNLEKFKIKTTLDCTLDCETTGSRSILFP